MLDSLTNPDLLATGLVIINLCGFLVDAQALLKWQTHKKAATTALALKALIIITFLITLAVAKSPYGSQGWTGLAYLALWWLFAIAASLASLVIDVWIFAKKKN